MSSQRIFHALTLHLYQPPGQLEQLLQESGTELQRMLACYERIPRQAQKYADVAQLHVVFSIPLLQQLTDPQFINQICHLADIPSILEGFRSAPNIEFVASGYQHAPLPLIPVQDWDAQLRSESRLIEERFGHQPKGYYPPGGLFEEKMIPHLVAAGYRYVLLPKTTLLDGAGNPVDPYHAYQLDQNLMGIPIDEGFSHAQEHFIEAPWFADEVNNGTRIAPESGSTYLVTTFSDGDDGEWFRRGDEENGFFGHFFGPYMEFCETGEYPIRPVNLVDYLQQATPEPAHAAKLDIQSLEHPVLEQLDRVCRQYWQQVNVGEPVDPAVRELILQAEGSGFIFDQDPNRQKMAALLGRIENLLAPPKASAASSTNKDYGKATVATKSQEEASPQTGDDRPAATKTPATDPKSSPGSVAKKKVSATAKKASPNTNKTRVKSKGSGKGVKARRPKPSK